MLDHSDALRGGVLIEKSHYYRFVLIGGGEVTVKMAPSVANDYTSKILGRNAGGVFTAVDLKTSLKTWVPHAAIVAIEDRGEVDDDG